MEQLPVIVMILSRWRALTAWKRNMRADCSLQWEAKRPELIWVKRLKQMLLLRQRSIHTDVHYKLETMLLHWWKANVTVTCCLFRYHFSSHHTAAHRLWTTSEWESTAAVYLTSCSLQEGPWKPDTPSFSPIWPTAAKKHEAEIQQTNWHAELSTYNC